MNFTERELNAIDAALIIAASVYHDDARTMRKENQPRVAIAFQEQEAEARKLAERIGSRKERGEV